jgi:predicted  nucleic acid-binding Zn-ribbon protein
MDWSERASEAKDSRIRDLLVEIEILKAENAAGRQRFAEVSTELKALDEENTAARSEIARLGH